MKKFIPRSIVFILAIFLLFSLILTSTYLLSNHTNGRIESSGMMRKYLLYVPDSYDPSTPTPLVISIHGFAEWPAHQMQISHWNDLADENGFIVVYPSGTEFPLRWNAYNRPGTKISSAEEVQFISDLIDHLATAYNLDPARIYANGLSNGGGMTVLLACQLSTRIAAIGSVSGAYLLPGDRCQPTRPLPLIAFHGTEDPIVPYEGGSSHEPMFESTFPKVSSWVLAWADRNECDPTSVSLPANGEVTGVQYSSCNQNADVVFYTIHAGGHAWPGGEALPEFIVGHTTQDIDATRVMWEFFRQHPLN